MNLEEKMMTRQWEYEYIHQGYIAEDHDHVSWDEKDIIDELDGAKSTKDALLFAMMYRLDDGSLDFSWIEENCDYKLNEKNGTASLTWNFSDADGNGCTKLTIKEIKD